MCSYERQANETYRNVRQPAYNVLSYTWGRWQVADGPALVVSNITWRVPAVHPDAFTVEQFRTVLKRVSRGVDWVWVDIACIDQDNEEVKLDEVGRQAGIFDNSNEAFVWLHQSTIENLEELSENLFWVHDEYTKRSPNISPGGSHGISPCVLDDTWLQAVESTLKVPETDPWFSSLWTLQESFMNPTAWILSKDAKEMLKPDRDRAALLNMFIWWGSVKMGLHQVLDATHGRQARSDITRHQGIAARMERLGIDGYDTPAVLYAAAGYRKTSREEDRVYGIMQVFGFKLGKSAEPKRDFTLSDLELQIAAALNAKSPIWAQLFSHTSIPQHGRHWCISQGSRAISLHLIHPQSQCRIQLDSQSRGVFTGLKCSFSKLASDWRETKKVNVPCFWAEISDEVLHPVESIYLDVCEFTQKYVPPELRDLRNPVDPRQVVLTNMLIERLGDDVQVLLLGTLFAIMDEDEDDEDVGDDADASIGMIQDEPGEPLFIPDVFPYTYEHIEELGDWPQRLLHVPSMTSYEWQPGNIYGGYHQPAYRAISYTWGRWRLHSDHKRDVKPLVIHNVPWDVPRIDPHHFTVSQLQRVVQTACSASAFTGSSRGIHRNLRRLPETEFVWLDIACIDQRWGPLAAMEVGRQAAIFSKSSGVAIWLSQTGRDEASRDCVENFVSSILSREYDDEGDIWREGVLKGTRELLRDPWFTSLWTLQEAFLCGDAYFMSAHADVLEAIPYWAETPGAFTLATLARACLQLESECRLAVEKQQEGYFESTWLGWMQKSGLTVFQGTSANPLLLFPAARHRITSKEQDRIYGIMQVFGYKLGTSANPDRSYTRSELADQLGQELLNERPVQSQLHSLTQPVEPGKAWCISQASSIARGYRHPTPHLESQKSSPLYCKPECSLSTQEVSGTLFGLFEGKVCEFGTLQSAWQDIDSESIHRNSDGIPSYRPTVNLYPDVTEFLYDSPEYHGWSLVEIPEECERQNAFGRWMAERFKYNRFLVLLMGGTAYQRFGLLLLHVKAGQG
ncbi:hypothetical protein SLS58_008242 [Diplodia intermedia]|uniref:Heterokaryon incompatibility domain-containing protein n=1 Tax=Diplodia intermedia TaxID=856260 RepID=A0ABR3TI08_9PEZI